MSLPRAKDFTNSNKNRDVPNPGVHMARLVGITDLGVQPAWEYEGKVSPAKHKIEFTYELPNSLMGDGRPHWVSEDIPVNFAVSDTDPAFTSTLMKRMQVLNPECNGEDWSLLLGCPCMVTIHHNKNGYPKISKDAISGMPAGIEVGELKNPSFLFDWDEATQQDWEDLKSPLAKKRILEADNFVGSKLQATIEGTDYEAPF